MTKALGMLIAAALSSCRFAGLRRRCRLPRFLRRKLERRGKFRISAGASPMPVSCSFDAETSATSLSLDGNAGA